MKKNVLVVGGGIGGITSAYFEAKKGNNVTLIDSSERIGGLLKSDYNGKNYFDYGTHIIPETSIPELNDFLFSLLDDENSVRTKNIKASSFFNGKMNNKSCYVDCSVIDKELYNRGCVEFLEAENEESNNLDEKLINKFGKTFYTEILKKNIEKYTNTDPALLDIKVGEFFDMSRLLVFNDSVTKRLCTLPIYNSKMGHHVRVDGSMKYYPKDGGVGKIIDLLESKLQKAGVKILKNTKINKIINLNGIIRTVETKNENFNIDDLIWTLPSEQLLKILDLDVENMKNLEFINAGLFDFTFDKKIASEATFINVFDNKLLSGRITLYQNLAKNKNYSCTVEVLSAQNDLEKKIDIVYNELIEMGLVTSENQVKYRKYRKINKGFPILSKDFVESQHRVNNFCEEYFKNVKFVGRSTSKDFFMPEVLVNAYNKITKE